MSPRRQGQSASPRHPDQHRPKRPILLAVDQEPADRRVRLDPNDPSTSRHAGQCEHRYTSDPALLRVILKVKEGAGGGYWWVECATCEHGWQVPHYPQPPMRLMPPPK
jgi:hypothetical protein